MWMENCEKKKKPADVFVVSFDSLPSYLNSLQLWVVSELLLSLVKLLWWRGGGWGGQEKEKILFKIVFNVISLFSADWIHIKNTVGAIVFFQTCQHALLLLFLLLLFFQDILILVDFFKTSKIFLHHSYF